MMKASANKQHLMMVAKQAHCASELGEELGLPIRMDLAKSGSGYQSTILTMEKKPSIDSWRRNLNVEVIDMDEVIGEEVAKRGQTTSSNHVKYESRIDGKRQKYKSLGSRHVSLQFSFHKVESPQ